MSKYTFTSKFNVSNNAKLQLLVTKLRFPSIQGILQELQELDKLQLTFIYFCIPIFNKKYKIHSRLAYINP